MGWTCIYRGKFTSNYNIPTIHCSFQKYSISVATEDLHTFEPELTEYTFIDSDDNSIGSLDTNGSDDSQVPVVIPHVRLCEEIID